MLVCLLVFGFGFESGVYGSVNEMVFGGVNVVNGMGFVDDKVSTITRTRGSSRGLPCGGSTMVVRNLREMVGRAAGN